MFINTILIYPILLIKSTAKRSFTGLGKIIKKSGNAVRKILANYNHSLKINHKIAQDIFKNSRELTLSIDDTLIKKIYSKKIAGVGYFFDTKIGKTIRSYRLMACILTNGKYNIPINFDFLFDKNLVDEKDEMKTKLQIIQFFYKSAKTIFPDKIIKIAFDGLFASVEILTWFVSNKIKLDARMHSNRKVEYKGKLYKIKEIKDLVPVGRQKSRTISIKWHNLKLFLTAELRTDKNNETTIVYIVSTYKSRSKDHVDAYKRRWPIEMLFRTSKQYLGLEQCFSVNLDLQKNHIASVFLAYSLAQLEMYEKKMKTPEDAIRAIKHKNMRNINRSFIRSEEIFEAVYA